MGKVKIDVSSTQIFDYEMCQQRTGIMSISFNNVKIIDAVQLLEEITILEFDAEFIIGDNTITFDLLNTFGGINSDGTFQPLKISIHQIDISQNEIDYTTIMPDSECAFLHVTDTKNALMSVKINEERDGWILIPSITELEVYGIDDDNTTFTFSINS